MITKMSVGNTLSSSAEIAGQAQLAALYIFRPKRPLLGLHHCSVKQEQVQSRAEHTVDTTKMHVRVIVQKCKICDPYGQYLHFCSTCTETLNLNSALVYQYMAAFRHQKPLPNLLATVNQNSRKHHNLPICFHQLMHVTSIVPPSRMARQRLTARRFVNTQLPAASLTPCFGILVIKLEQGAFSLVQNSFPLLTGGCCLICWQALLYR